MQDPHGAAAPRVALVDDPLFLEHRSPEPHPERPERLGAARRAVDAASSLGFRELPARDASDAELGRVHGPGYLEKLTAAAGNTGRFDADTFYSPQSVAAAKRAAGGAIAMTEALCRGESDYGLALLRPPGHHARPDHAMGFCLLNNVAVATEHAKAQGAAKVAVIDWDVHHGNGTQEIFYADPSVLYVSLHQYPWYPGTGASGELGRGTGRGYTVNVPFAADADDASYLAAFQRLLVPVLHQFDPDLVLVSAGFDAHERDPLAQMRLSSDAYGQMTRAIMGALPAAGRGRLGFVLEGGYDLTAVEQSLAAVLAELHHPASAAGPLPAPDPTHERGLRECEQLLGSYWKL